MQVSHPGQPDFLAPLRVVAQYRATTEAGPGRLSFDERDATMASGDPSLADYYVEDLDFDHLGHPQFGLQQPSAS